MGRGDQVSAIERKAVVVFVCLFVLSYYLMCMCVYVVSVHTLATVHAVVSRTTYGDRFSFSPRMSPRDKTHLIRLGGKHIYLLSYLPSPRTFVESHRVS